MLEVLPVRNRGRDGGAGTAVRPQRGREGRKGEHPEAGQQGLGEASSQRRPPSPVSPRSGSALKSPPRSSVGGKSGPCRRGPASTAVAEAGGQSGTARS